MWLKLLGRVLTIFTTLTFILQPLYCTAKSVPDDFSKFTRAHLAPHSQTDIAWKRVALGNALQSLESKVAGGKSIAPKSLQPLRKAVREYSANENLDIFYDVISSTLFALDPASSSGVIMRMQLTERWQNPSWDAIAPHDHPETLGKFTIGSYQRSPEVDDIVMPITAGALAPRASQPGLIGQMNEIYGRILALDEHLPETGFCLKDSPEKVRTVFPNLPGDLDQMLQRFHADHKNEIAEMAEFFTYGDLVYTAGDEAILIMGRSTVGKTRLAAQIVWGTPHTGKRAYEYGSSDLIHSFIVNGRWYAAPAQSFLQRNKYAPAGAKFDSVKPRIAKVKAIFLFYESLGTAGRSEKAHIEETPEETAFLNYQFAGFSSETRMSYSMEARKRLSGAIAAHVASYTIFVSPREGERLGRPSEQEFSRLAKDIVKILAKLPEKKTDEGTPKGPVETLRILPYSNLDEITATLKYKNVKRQIKMEVDERVGPVKLVPPQGSKEKIMVLPRSEVSPYLDSLVPHMLEKGYKLKAKGGIGEINGDFRDARTGKCLGGFRLHTLSDASVHIETHFKPWNIAEKVAESYEMFFYHMIKLFLLREMPLKTEIVMEQTKRSPAACKAFCEIFSYVHVDTRDMEDIALGEPEETVHRTPLADESILKKALDAAKATDFSPISVRAREGDRKHPVTLSEFRQILATGTAKDRQDLLYVFCCLGAEGINSLGLLPLLPEVSKIAAGKGIKENLREDFGRIENELRATAELGFSA